MNKRFMYECGWVEALSISVQVLLNSWKQMHVVVVVAVVTVGSNHQLHL